MTGGQVTKSTEKNEVETKLLQDGLAHHRSGSLNAAASCYAKLLATQPQHADALNLLGVIARQRNDLITSERLILAAIDQNPGVATYHHHLGKTYALQGRSQEAAQSYRRALCLNPEDLDSMQLLASLRSETGDWNEVCELYGRLRQMEPGKAEWLYRLAQVLKIQGRMNEALVCYRQAVVLYPNSVDAQFNLGKALFEAGERSESLQCFRRLVAIHPDDAVAQNYLGQILHELGEAGQARQAYLEAIRARPEFVEALSNLGALLLDMSELKKAELLLRRALQLAPEFACACTNLGTVLVRQGRYLEACETFRELLVREPTHATALCSVGFSLDVLGDLDGARKCFQLALTAEPDSALVRFNLSSHLLLDGNFAEGWSWYEQRWNLRQFTGKLRTCPQRRWNGEDIAGTSIFLFAEQGFGDTLQFVRYALLLVELGARVLLEVQAPLVQVLQTLHPDVYVFAKDQEEVPSTDWQCPLLSLPKVFGTDLTTIPVAVPYVHADKKKTEEWDQRLHAPGLKVGVVWSGNPAHNRDRLRSIPFEQFCHVLHTPQVSFYSLQKGPAAMQARTVDLGIEMCDLEPCLLDFTDTAAVIANLDLVITVDTAIAHLAGAMGKPVWILLAYAPDWRWLKERSDSPWYPTAKLFRQSSPGQWAGVLEQVKNDIHALACATEQALSPIGDTCGPAVQDSGKAWCMQCS